MRYIVVVKVYGTDEVVDKIDCGSSYRRAERTEEGLNLHLMHELYYTDIEEID